MRINLTDNCIASESQLFHRDEIRDLFPLADKSLEELCKDNENLLVFPENLQIGDDKIGESFLLKIKNTDNPNKVRIETGNIMGFFGNGSLKVRIQSRFDNGEEDYFLHYMLQKVLSFNVFNLNHNNEHEDVFDFIMFLFPYMLNKALRQGIFREYRSIKHNDTNIKGTIDVNRHISRNTPLGGKVAYSTREYVNDNSLTQLIRHTIEYIKTSSYSDTILNLDQETIENVKCIMEYTPSYSRTERGNIINKNLRIKPHPFFTEYRPLQILCLQILRMEEMKYGENDDEICGVLFDGAWLWEEYLNTILHGCGFIHPANKLKSHPIYLFEGKSGKRYPDFYKEDIVLDAKYKRIASYDMVSKMDRDDIHQIIAYMQNLKASRGGFIAPIHEKQTHIPTSTLKGTTSTISILGLEISKAMTYSEFCNDMHNFEEKLSESLKSI